jgi:hypothetical protein
MPTDEEFAWMKSLIEAVGGAQARNTVHHYILRDIAMELAKREPDPEGYLAAMFERVSRLIDEGETDASKPDIVAEMRFVTESFFTRAAQGVKSRK